MCAQCNMIAIVVEFNDFENHRAFVCVRVQTDAHRFGAVNRKTAPTSERQSETHKKVQQKPWNTYSAVLLSHEVGRGGKRWCAKIKWNEFNLPILRNSMHTGLSLWNWCEWFVWIHRLCRRFFSLSLFVCRRFCIETERICNGRVQFFSHFHNMYRVVFFFLLRRRLFV